MKKIFLGAILMASLVACNKKPEYAIISGKANTSDTYLRLMTDTSFVREIILNQDGTFRDTIFDLLGNQFLLMDANQQAGIPLYLEQGAEVDITFNKDIATAKVTGKGSEKTQYLLDKNTHLALRVDENLFMKEPAEFKQILKNAFEGLTEKLNGYKFDKKFADAEKRWIDYTYLVYLNEYPSYNQYLTKSEERVVVPEDFMADVAKIDYDIAEDFDKIMSYKRLVGNYYAKMVTDPTNPEQVSAVIEALKKAKAENIKKEISAMLVSFMNPKNPTNELIYNFMQNNVSDSILKVRSKQAYEAGQKLVKGAPAPTFEYENYKGGTTKLEDLRGKIVYIDIWATWCLPCRKEIPFLKELEKEFHNKPIEFVSISIDRQEDKGKWREFIEKEGLKGIQLITENAGNSQFMNDCYVTGIPLFILIDKEGNLIDIDAPRPSDPEIKEVLKSLL